MACRLPSRSDALLACHKFLTDFACQFQKYEFFYIISQDQEKKKCLLSSWMELLSDVLSRNGLKLQKKVIINNLPLLKFYFYGNF